MTSAGKYISCSCGFSAELTEDYRLIGAPYWAVRTSFGVSLQDAIELERMESSWDRAEDIEVFAEGDVYPRPRYNCPASYLEGFDTALRASGAFDGILRISIDYVSNVGCESGYLKKYLKNKPNKCFYFLCAQAPHLFLMQFVHNFLTMNI